MAVVAGYLELGDVAATLAIAELHVKRLIARGHLMASRVGVDGPFRVAEAGLQKYIAANCPDLRGPKLEGIWFDGRDDYLADRLIQAVIDAAADQVLPIEKVEAMFADASVGTKSIDVLLRVTPAIATVLAAPRPHSAFAPPASKLTPAREEVSWKLAAVIVHLRTAVWTKINARLNIAEAGVAALYSSPERYRELTGAAVEEVKRRRIVFSEMYGATMRVYYMLRYSLILTQAELQEAVRLAF
jgi:hypothetical protein